ncbi:MAG: glycoside hydrolase family protein [Pseudomonadota bacterium]
MKISAVGIELIKRFEGLELESYQDIAGIWTIGYGHTETAGPDQRITEREAEQLLKQDLTPRERAVDDLTNVSINQNEFDALVSFVYNVGIEAYRGSTARRRLNRGDRLGAADALTWWNKATVNGVLVQVNGLTRRRAAERALFLTPVEPIAVNSGDRIEENSRVTPIEEAPRRASLGESRTLQGATVAGGAGAAAATMGRESAEDLDQLEENIESGTRLTVEPHQDPLEETGEASIVRDEPPTDIFTFDDGADDQASDESDEVTADGAADEAPPSDSDTESDPEVDAETIDDAEDDTETVDCVPVGSVEETPLDEIVNAIEDVIDSDETTDAAGTNETGSDAFDGSDALPECPVEVTVDETSDEPGEQPVEEISGSDTVGLDTEDLSSTEEPDTEEPDTEELDTEELDAEELESEGTDAVQSESSEDAPGDGDAPLQEEQNETNDNEGELIEGVEQPLDRPSKHEQHAADAQIQLALLVLIVLSAVYIIYARIEDWWNFRR